ncbi:alpha/beta fold hydrolase [Microbacterium sp. GXF7504]
MTTRATFEPDGRAISYIDEGEGPATIVLLPGLGLNPAYLGTLASVLVELGFRVLRLRSRRTPAATLHDHAQDAVDVMDHTGVADAWIGGHGFGGAVARTVALDHHDRANGILILGALGDEQPAADAAGALETLTSLPADAAAPDELRALVGEKVKLDLAWPVYAGSRDLTVAEGQQAALDATPAAEWAELAADLPVLVIQGDDDRITVPANGQALKAAAPARTSVVTIPNGGHLVAMTHPGDVAMAIEDYLGWD